jgi:FkbM family methyltransferase
LQSWFGGADPSLAGVRLLFVPNATTANASSPGRGKGGAGDGVAAEQLFAAAAAAVAAAAASPPHQQRRPSSRGSSRRAAAAAASLRKSAICWLTLALALALLFVQAISCGFFFCVAPGLPQLGGGAAGPRAAGGGSGGGGGPASSSSSLAAGLAGMEDGGGGDLGADFGELVVPLGRGGGGGGGAGALPPQGAGASLLAGLSSSMLSSSSPPSLLWSWGGLGALRSFWTWRSPAHEAAAAVAATAATAAATPAPTAATATTPRLIPRVLHQTWPAHRASPQRRALARTCARAAGPGWTVRLWDDASAAALVRSAFPEYFEAYALLPRDVERADFFRYMALLRFGGVVADTDVECVRPLDDVILPADTLVAGWGAFAANGGGGAASGGANNNATSSSPSSWPPRQRTVATWMLAAAPGHPALRELCERVARGAGATFSASSAVRDTAERTGAALVTDVLLRHAVGGVGVGGRAPFVNVTTAIPGGGGGVAARGGRPHSGQDPWRVRILPLVAFGASASGDSATPAAATIARDSPGVVAVHHALGTWEGRAEARAAAALLRRAERAWARKRGPAEEEEDGGEARAPAPSTASPSSPDAAAVRAALKPDPPLGLPDGVAFYPVAVAFDPPFSALVPPLDEEQLDQPPAHSSSSSDADVGASLLAWGEWQPGPAPAYRRPTLLEAVVGALATRTGAPGADEVGADSAPSLPSSSSSSSSQRPLQTLVDVGAGLGLFSLAAAARGHRAVAFELAPQSLSALRAAVQHNGFGALVTPLAAAVGAKPGRVCLGVDGGGGGGVEEAGCPPRAVADSKKARRARVSRGYASPCDRPSCSLSAPRVTLSEVLGNDTSVGALRIGALHGHEARVLDGALAFLKRVARPSVVAVEWSPRAMAAAGDPDGPQRVLRVLHEELGYRDVAHAGPLCDERWANAMMAAAGGAAGSRHHHRQQRPTWCRLPAAQFGALVARALQPRDAPLPPESLLFMLPPGGAGA